MSSVPAYGDDVWRALQDHLLTKDNRFAVETYTSTILDPGLVISSLGRVTLPLDNAQLALMRPWFQRLPGDHWQFKALPDCAARVTTSGEWDAYVSQTVKEAAVRLGMPVEGIRHSLCRLTLEEGHEPARPGPVFKSDIALRSQGVVATVTFYLPTPRLKGGQIHFAHLNDTFLTVDTSPRETPTITIVGSYVDLEQRCDPIWSPGSHRMALVYGIHVPPELRPGEWPSAERMYIRQNSVRHILARWKNVGGNSALIHVLENQTSEFKILKWGATYRTSIHALGGQLPKDLKKGRWEAGFPLQSPKLKGKDSVVVRAMYSIAKQLGIGIYMADLVCVERCDPETNHRSISTEVNKLLPIVDDSDNTRTHAPIPVEPQLVADEIQFMPSDDTFLGMKPDSVEKDGFKVYERIVLVLRSIGPHDVRPSQIAASTFVFG